MKLSVRLAGSSFSEAVAAARNNDPHLLSTVFYRQCYRIQERLLRLEALENGSRPRDAVKAVDTLWLDIDVVESGRHELRCISETLGALKAEPYTASLEEMLDAKDWVYRRTPARWAKKQAPGIEPVVA